MLLIIKKKKKQENISDFKAMNFFNGLLLF